MPINYYNDRVCLNVLGGSLQNAADIYKAAEGHVEVGVLTADYDTVEAGYRGHEQVHGRPRGQPLRRPGRRQSQSVARVAEVAKEIKANHFNQAFCAVSATRANVGNDECHINAMVGPSGTPG